MSKSEKFAAEIKSLPVGYFILAIMMVAGLSVALYRLYAGLGATTNLSDAFPWGIWISFDLVIVAFSGGAFTLAALVYVFHLHELHSAIRPTVLAGLIGYASVLAILFLDLGRWDRAYHFLIYPNFNSALFEVSWCISLYSLILLSELSPVLLKGPKWAKVVAFIQRWTIPIVIAGVTLSTLHQSSLGTLFIVMSPRLHPLWYSMLLPVFFLVSSLAAGLAMIIAGSDISYWVFKHSLKEKVVAELAWFLPWVLALYLVLKLGELEVAHELHLLWESGVYSVLFTAELVIGVIIPIILFSFKKVRHSRIGSLVGASFVLAGIVLNRFDVSWFAMKPIDGLRYWPSWMEIAMLVGVLSLAVLVYSLVSRYFPVFEETAVVSGHKHSDADQAARAGGTAESTPPALNPEPAAGD